MKYPNNNNNQRSLIILILLRLENTTVKIITLKSNKNIFKKSVMFLAGTRSGKKFLQKYYQITLEKVTKFHGKFFGSKGI